MKKLIVFILIVIASTIHIYSQSVKVVHENNGYSWLLTNYTLTEMILDYWVYDEHGKCVRGGTMDWTGFYTPNYFTKEKGIYILEVWKYTSEDYRMPYEQRRRRLIKKEFEVK